MPSMMTERTSGHSARGSPRRVAVVSIQSMSPWRAVGQELPQPVERLRDGVGARHADDVETLRARRLGERGLQRGGIVQKSRSA